MAGWKPILPLEAIGHCWSMTNMTLTNTELVFLGVLHFIFRSLFHSYYHGCWVWSTCWLELFRLWALELYRTGGGVLGIFHLHHCFVYRADHRI